MTSDELLAAELHRRLSVDNCRRLAELLAPPKEMA